MRWSFLLLTACLPSLPAATFELVDKTEVSCDHFEVDPSTPQAFLMASKGNSTTAYPFSAILLEGLPEEARQRFVDYQAKQLAHRLILNKDHWVHRDELLIDADPRYHFQKVLMRGGDCVLKVVNTTHQTATIGVRSDIHGWDMHIEAGKTRGYPVAAHMPLTILWAYEAEDGASLTVERMKPETFEHHTEFTVTLTEEPTTDQQIEVGSVPIPPQYQVRP